MKNLHKTNRALMIITGVLYLTIYLGLIFQIALGTIQVIMTIYMLFHFSTYNRKVKQLLKIYTFLTTIVLTLIFTNYYANTHNDFYQILLWAVIPLSLAFLHLYITYLIQKQ